MSEDSGAEGAGRTPGAVFFLAGALLSAWFYLIRAELQQPGIFLFGYDFNLPSPGYGLFLSLFVPFGCLVAVAYAAGWARLFAGSPTWLEGWNHLDDRRFVIYGSVFGALIPALIHTALLHGGPLTDDESAYHFMGQTMALGQLYAESPPSKVFFDNPFLINDGKLYPMYFVGWPALLALGHWLGLAGFVGALCSGLTVPALFWTLRRWCGSAWARLGVLLYLTSSMLAVGAATATSHASCLMALAWTVWFCLRSQDDDAPLWVHGAAASAFSLAFFIRPASALGIGLPFLVYWAMGRLRRRSLAPVLAFAVPALIGAGLFFAVNKVQTGDWLTVAYERAYDYAAENGFRFSLWEAVQGEEGDGELSEIGFGDWRRGLAVQGAGLLRLGFALFGWPCWLALAFWAGRGTESRLLWASMMCFLAVHLSVHNVGIDTFAPMHYVEVAWPLLLLTVLGVQRLTRTLRDIDDRLGSGSRLRVWPAALVAGLMMANLSLYAPLRLATVEKIADDIRRPAAALEAQGIENGVIFVRGQWVRYCESAPDRGWVFHRPNNDPGLQNPVLWVNHLSLDENRLFMQRHFPDRQGFFMVQDPKTCRIAYVPLEELTPQLLSESGGPESNGPE